MLWCLPLLAFKRAADTTRALNSCPLQPATMLLIAILALCLASGASAQTPLVAVKIASIGGKPGYHLAADNQSYFAQFGVSVTLVSVPNSAVGFQGLANGSWPIFSAVVDNLVERIVNEGQTYAQVVAGSDQGKGVGLYGSTVNGITSYAALQGKPLTVDDFKSGLTPALLYMLQQAIPNPTTPWPVVGNPAGFQVLGGTPLRYAALKVGYNGTTAIPTYATMLITPYDVLAAPNANFTLLQTLAGVSSITAPFQSAAIMTNKAWAQANKCTLARVLAAFIRGDRFQKDPANAAVMIALLKKALGSNGINTDALAASVLADIVNPVTGENKDVKLNRQGMINVCYIRTAVNGFFNATVAGGSFTPPNCKNYANNNKGLYDAQYHDAAMSLVDEGDDGSCSTASEEGDADGSDRGNGSDGLSPNDDGREDEGNK